MLTAATFTLLLWVAPPLELSDAESKQVREMAQEYKSTARCETGVLARVFLINGEKKVLLECYAGQLV